MLLGWEGAFFHFLGILGKRGLDRLGQSSVTFDMFGHMIGVQPQHVVQNLDLAVTIGAGTDADRGNLQTLGD